MARPFTFLAWFFTVTLLLPSYADISTLCDAWLVTKTGLCCYPFSLLFLSIALRFVSYSYSGQGTVVQEIFNLFVFLPLSTMVYYFKEKLFHRLKNIVEL